MSRKGKRAPGGSPRNGGGKNLELSEHRQRHLTGASLAGPTIASNCGKPPPPPLCNHSPHRLTCSLVQVAHAQTVPRFLSHAIPRSTHLTVIASPLCLSTMAPVSLPRPGFHLPHTLAAWHKFRSQHYWSYGSRCLNPTDVASWRAVHPAPAGRHLVSAAEPVL